MTARARLDVTGEVLLFDCPACEFMHAARVKPPTSAAAMYRNAVWTWNESLEAPTLEPSLRVCWDEGEERAPRVCHSFVRGGRIEFLGDCTHALAGQTVDLPPVS